MKRVAALLPLWSMLIVSCGPAVSSAVFTDVAPRAPVQEIRLYSTKSPTAVRDARAYGITTLENGVHAMDIFRLTELA